MAIDGFKDFDQSGNGLVAGGGAQSPDIIQRTVAGQASSGSGGLQEPIVQNEEMIVARALDVNLDKVDADAQSGFNGKQGVAGRVSGGATMSDAKSAHEPIMPDSPTGEDSRTGADAPSVAHIERWYRENCSPISEICIVPLEDHRHAIIVPDIASLKEERHSNSRELIRFEFHEVSKQLPTEQRPDTFSLRSTPLPRTSEGQPDRDRLRIEIAERSPFSAEGPDFPEDPMEGSISELIRFFQPGAACERDANLELDLGFDSLDRVLLVASAEKTFDITIPADQAARIFTVGDLIDAVRQRPPRPPAIATVSWSEALRRPLDGAEHSLANSILKQRPVLTLVAWGVARLLRLIWRHRFQFEVHGREWVLPEGPYLMAANHCSHLDPLFLLWALPYRVTRRLSFLGHTEYFGSGWKAAAAKRLKLVPVDPDEHARSGLRLSAEALRRGMIGAVFPEGERSPNGALQRFHRGLALIARELELPILPVAICGSYEVLPRGKTQIHHAPVQVRFGPPLRPDPGETEQNLLARLWAAVSELRAGDARPREPIPIPMAIHWDQTK